MKNNIFKREVFDDIVKYMEDDVVIVLNGARQVGKTCILYYIETYLKQKGERVYYLDLEDSRLLQILNRGVDAFLGHLDEEGFNRSQQVFVLLDEIQYLDNPSSFLKLVNDHHKKIKLIVSGSSSFEIKKKFKDSLVGRTVNFEIFPLNFREFLEFKNYTFLQGIPLSEKKVDELRQLSREFILYGSYPRIVLTAAKEKKEKFLEQIIETYIRKDIRDIGNIRDIDKFNKLVTVLASQSGNLINIQELSNTCGIAKQTVEYYLFLLENTYIIKLLRPFSRNIRSELFKTPKVMFYDSGLLQMLWLKTIPNAVVGNVFETAIFSELVKRFGKDHLYYWRTKDKKEIDFILQRKNQILPIEAKINFSAFSKSSKNTVKYFLNHYLLEDYKVIALEGNKKDKHDVYIWEEI